MNGFWVRIRNSKGVDWRRHSLNRLNAHSLKEFNGNGKPSSIDS